MAMGLAIFALLVPAYALAQPNEEEEKPESQKLLDIVTLEALRFILKDIDEFNFDIIMKRFPYFIS